MGNISSRPGDGDSLLLKDQNRFFVSAITVTNPRNRTILSITPNAFPATRYIAKRDIGDESVIEYVQDPDSTSAAAPPNFLLRLSNDEEITFNFTIVLRQTSPGTNGASANPSATADTSVKGLTYVFAPSSKELQNLVTREFQADPNFHKNPNVQLLGDYTTGGSSSVQFHWSWKWRPPRTTEDRGGGWRNSCSFAEYDERAHRLDTLASFSFYVANTQKLLGSPKSPSLRLDVGLPPRLRVPSAQSFESRVSDSDGAEYRDFAEPRSPAIEPKAEYGLGLVPTMTNATANTDVKVDINCQRPGDDLSSVDDGPLFRATLKTLELKTGSMRSRWKKVLKKAEAALDAQVNYNSAMKELMESFHDVSSSSANAVQPAIDHYFDKIAKDILAYERQNTVNLQKLIIDPINRLYNVDIKQVDSKKEDFEKESRDYYQYVSRYLGQRQDSLKEKKRAETDSKYQVKRRNFELRRFDYASFMQDLHGGRKDQEVLSYLTRYADAQAKGFLKTAKNIEAMLPQLEALSFEVKEADKEYQLQRTDREEKRRAIEKSTKAYIEPETPTTAQQQTPSLSQANGARPGMPERNSRSVSNAAEFRSVVSPPPYVSPPQNGALHLPSPGQGSATPGNNGALVVGSPNQNKFKGIRDMEEKDYTALGGPEGNGGQQRKEGLLWALSRPGSHVDPKGLNKQAWHKFWIVLDQGKLSEYTNWKERLDLHMDPIDLRVASVREARNAERRFCFEVITPQFKRVYQATSEEDMKSWICAINNALQSAVEGKGKAEPVTTESLPGSTRRDIASVLTGKSSSMSHHRSSHGGNADSRTVSRHATDGHRPSHITPEAHDEDPIKLLQQIRDADAGNKNCADCGSDSKVEWVSINLGIILCIECSGIHRSLGTHISKVRSLTLDTTSFTLDTIEVLLTIGNRVSNMIWEARLDSYLKPTPTSTREQRLRFITAKYADRAFVQPISTTLSPYSTPDETLLASIKKNDIQNVLYALALRANPNATDRSRATHAVYLALAAADPALPAQTVSSLPSPGRSPSGTGTPPPPRAKPFAVAEMLLQNGADIPASPAPIALSPAAKLYLEQKTEQRSGKRFSAAGGTARMPGRASVAMVGRARAEMPGFGSGDALAALPSIAAGNGSTPGERARERESRLQKRVSAGGRLVKGGGGDGGV
ncbi:hypothetical protein H2201_001055 [Coniosporium apollinis]|uniref:ADP-ribosylation factor GTPase-activating protein n=1 Tax=Coniosporium apollinis TaxID=61459 RepID=A0ABQ9P5G7_9PEZI|nr:hypothetical protein H2201_001055 [Coniosporium apollinis]